MLKVDIRKEYKQKRRGLTNQERYELSSQIAELVARSFSLENKTVSVFLPIDRLNEINTTFLIDQLKISNCTVSTPVSDFETLLLKHVIYTDETVLKNNDWGIPEPVEGDQILPEDLDIVFVPLLVTDKQGYRVGYGKGFYDRFLSQCSKGTLFIGLNYFDDFVFIEDINEEDVPVHYLVTPNKLIEF